MPTRSRPPDRSARSSTRSGRRQRDLRWRRVPQMCNRCVALGLVGMVNVRAVDYEVAGVQLRATMAVPDGDGPFPGVLIGHEGPGLDDVQRARAADIARLGYVRSEEHTSELQSPCNLVCRLLL